MSKEALEKIKSAEKESRSIIEKAQKDAENAVKRAEEEIFAERTAFLEKQRAERSERLRRTQLQMSSAEEEAKSAARQSYNDAEEGYSGLSERAISAAMQVIFEMR